MRALGEGESRETARAARPAVRGMDSFRKICLIGALRAGRLRVLMSGKRALLTETMGILGMLRRRKIQVTCLYSSFYLWIGLTIAAPGPSLLALARQTGAPLEQIGFIFTVRALTYVAGASSGGFLFDRFDPHRLMLIALSTCLVGTLVVPLARHIGVLAASMAAQGLVMGFLDTGVNSLLFVIHKDGRVEPFMQALHFFFGLGAFISPLVVGAVLDAYGGEVKVAWTILGLVGSPLLLLMLRYPTPGKPESEAFYADEMDPIPAIAASSAANAHSADADSVESAAIEPTRVNIEAADSAAQDADAAADDAAASSFFARPRSELGVIAASAGILYFAVGIEVCSGSFIPTFSVKSPLIGFNEHQGSSLVASFWASFTLARFVAIFVSVRLSPLQLLCSCLAGLGLSISVRC